MLLPVLIKAMTCAAVVLYATSAAATIVTDWNNAALAEVRVSKLGPPIVARALAIVHTCMYDAWAAYDEHAVGTVLGASLRQPLSEHSDANKAKAISFAAYRCLENLFPGLSSIKRLNDVMSAHGYDPTDASTSITPPVIATPVVIGNLAAAAVIEARSGDGSNQYGDLKNPQNTPDQCPVLAGPYSDYTCYKPRNRPLEFCIPLIDCTPFHVEDPYHWQPLINDQGVTQTFIGPHWELVTPFALTSAKQFDDMAIAPPPEVFKDPLHYLLNGNEILQLSRRLTAARKLIVEYWADGPASELPAGHWGLLAQFVSQRDQHSIDQDVKMFFAMHNASFDAGIVGWYFKRKYDGVRPITVIRYLKQGQTVRAFGGPGRPTEDIPGEEWMPYNPGSNLSPAFPGYISGHSVFSSASAEVLKLFTGSDDFGFSTVIPANFGRVEPGIPAVPTTITFATFSEAAQQAGLSRLYGGIHFSDDVTVGQALGVVIGQQAWAKAQTYFNGTAH